MRSALTSCGTFQITIGFRGYSKICRTPWLLCSRLLARHRLHLAVLKWKKKEFRQINASANYLPTLRVHQSQYFESWLKLAEHGEATAGDTAEMVPILTFVFFMNGSILSHQEKLGKRMVSAVSMTKEMEAKVEGRVRMVFDLTEPEVSTALGLKVIEAMGNVREGTDAINVFP